MGIEVKSWLVLLFPLHTLVSRHCDLYARHSVFDEVTNFIEQFSSKCQSLFMWSRNVSFYVEVLRAGKSP
jgi:hypothetical protein